MAETSLQGCTCGVRVRSLPGARRARNSTLKQMHPVLLQVSSPSSKTGNPLFSKGRCQIWSGNHTNSPQPPSPFTQVSHRHEFTCPFSRYLRYFSIRHDAECLAHSSSLASAFRRPLVYFPLCRPCFNGREFANLPIFSQLDDIPLNALRAFFLLPNLATNTSLISYRCTSSLSGSDTEAR